MTTHTHIVLRVFKGGCLALLVLLSSSVASAINYQYDSLNRLTNVDYGNGSIISYTYDRAGNRLTYSGAVANDIVLPTISITNPTSGSSFTTTNATLNLSGTASDNTGVTLIRWETVSIIGTASGTTSWNINSIPLQPGANSILVIAYDAAGNNTYAELRVTYTPPDSIPPTVSLTSPANGTTYTNAQTVAVTASASDDMAVTKVVFYDGSTAKGTNTTAPYSYNWSFTGADDGAHIWTVRAYDAIGNAATSSPPVTLTVSIDITPPTVSFLSPTNGQVITNASLTITGMATDPGSPSTGISTVEVRTNGASWQTATGTTSWTRSIRLSLLCNNIIEARSRDKAGNYSATNLISIIYTGANVAPNKPSNLSPTNSAINVPITPTLQASAFSDSNCGDAQAAAQWQVLLNGTGTTVVWDSGTNTINKTNIVVAAGKLSYWTTNRWQVRYRDSQGAWSSYSTQTMFITLPPSVSIRLQGTNAILTWPTNTTLFKLEYTTNMFATNWTLNSSTPKIVGGKYTITNGISGKAKFYHLKK